MFRSWIFILVLGVIADQDYNEYPEPVEDYSSAYDEYSSLLEEKLGLEPETNEQQISDQKSVEQQIGNQLDDEVNAANYEKKIANDDVDTAVLEEIAKFREQIDGNEDESRINDYQYEDNRSDAKDIIPEDAVDTQPNDDENQDVEPAESLAEADSNDDNFQEFKMDLPPFPDFEINDQIIADAKELLEEENSPSEEDLETDNTQENHQQIVNNFVEDTQDLSDENDHKDEGADDLKVQVPGSFEEDSQDQSAAVDEPLGIVDEDPRFYLDDQKYLQDSNHGFDDNSAEVYNDNQHLFKENDHLDGSNEFSHENKETDELNVHIPGSLEEESQEESAAMDEPPGVIYGNEKLYDDDNAEGEPNKLDKNINKEQTQHEQVNENVDENEEQDNDDNEDSKHLFNENDHMDDSNEFSQENEGTDELNVHIPGSFEEESQEESAAMDEPPGVIYENEKLYDDDNAEGEPNDHDKNINEEEQPHKQANENVGENEEQSNDYSEDTVDSVEKDLNADLEKIFEIWSKIRDESNENHDVSDYEVKYGKPFGESNILEQRNWEYYDDNTSIDSNLEDNFETVLKEDNSMEDDNNDEDPQNSDTVKKEVEIPYSDDAFAPQQQKPEDNSEQVKSAESENVNKDSDNTEETTFKFIHVEDLSPTVYDDLMKQFSMAHADELDTQSDDFGQNIAPIPMAINAEEVTEITSPNYPNPYPSNNIVDWMLEGDGTGIELNITDFEVRGANGDYLLVKPGGAEDTDHAGLVFSFYLNEPRRYRFTGINKLLLRFVSGPGLGFLKGFRLTTKAIWPPAAFDPEPAPEPEPLLPPPPETVTIVVGGITHEDFQEKKEEFRRILADMATMYINANDIEMGLNNTLEVTQITSTAVCNIHWPDYENCVVITFGVPLVYEDGPSTRLNRMDLTVMWGEYSVQDPFATRLRVMGIMEYAPPNDGRVLMVWLIVGAGAIISAVLLALAVWRYSCFEDYTRMKPYGDTDSLREEKPGLEDLYPTPHQNLPPMYGDNDLKWADAKYQDSTRVDIGGFTNRSYVRDDLFIESDEDDVTSRVHNKYTTDV